MRTSIRGCGPLALALVVACGGGTTNGTNDAGTGDTGSSSDVATGDSGNGGDAGTPDTSSLPDVGDRFDAEPIDTGITGGTFDLTGTWSSRIINSQCFDSPTLGKDTVNITTLSLVTITQNGNTANTTTQVCSVELTPFAGSQTTYPAAAISAIVVPPQVSALSGDTIGSTYVPARRVALLGWAATGDPATEALPTMANDSRNIDADADGNPGVTFNVAGTVSGSVYIVNRNIVDIDAVVTSVDRVEGRSHTVQEQKVVDAMPGILRFSSITATPNPDASSSTFLMVRLPGGVDTCEEIVAMASTLFSAPGAVVPCPP
jgi:hypothetical protein